MHFFARKACSPKALRPKGLTALRFSKVLRGQRFSEVKGSLRFSKVLRGQRFSKA